MQSMENSYSPSAAENIQTNVIDDLTAAKQSIVTADKGLMRNWLKRKTDDLIDHGIFDTRKTSKEGKPTCDSDIPFMINDVDKWFLFHPKSKLATVKEGELLQSSEEDTDFRKRHVPGEAKARKDVIRNQNVVKPFDEFAKIKKKLTFDENDEICIDDSNNKKFVAENKRGNRSRKLEDFAVRAISDVVEERCVVCRNMNCVDRKKFIEQNDNEWIHAAVKFQNSLTKNPLQEKCMNLRALLRKHCPKWMEHAKKEFPAVIQEPIDWNANITDIVMSVIINYLVIKHAAIHRRERQQLSRPSSRNFGSRSKSGIAKENVDSLNLEKNGTNSVEASDTKMPDLLSQLSASDEEYDQMLDSDRMNWISADKADSLDLKKNGTELIKKSNTQLSDLLNKLSLSDEEDGQVKLISISMKRMRVNKVDPLNMKVKGIELIKETNTELSDPRSEMWLNGESDGQGIIGSEHLVISLKETGTDFAPEVNTETGIPSDEDLMNHNCVSSSTTPLLKKPNKFAKENSEKLKRVHQILIKQKPEELSWSLDDPRIREVARYTDEVPKAKRLIAFKGNRNLCEETCGTVAENFTTQRNANQLVSAIWKSPKNGTEKENQNQTMDSKNEKASSSQLL